MKSFDDQNERRIRCTQMTFLSESDRGKLIEQAGNVIDLRRGLMAAKLYRRGYLQQAERYIAEV